MIFIDIYWFISYFLIQLKYLNICWDFTPIQKSGEFQKQRLYDIFYNLPNGQVLESRLEQQIVTESLSRMPQPCRIVVSGPSGFNAAARGMLIAAGVSHD